MELILLDFGLAEELTPRVRRHFISFFNAIAAGNGRRAAWHILHWSDTQACRSRPAFADAVDRMFREKCDLRSPDGIDLDDVMKSILRLTRQYEVTLDSRYASLVLGVCVLVGFATSLDPAVNIMDAAAPCLFTYALTGRIVGRLYG